MNHKLAMTSYVRSLTREEMDNYTGQELVRYAIQGNDGNWYYAAYGEIADPESEDGVSGMETPVKNADGDYIRI